MKLLQITIAFLICMAGQAWGGSYTFQQTSGVPASDSCTDSYGQSGGTNQRFNHGASENFQAGFWGNRYNAWIAWPNFDDRLTDSGVTAAEVDSGALEIYAYTNSSPTDTAWTLYQITQGWIEGVGPSGDTDSLGVTFRWSRHYADAQDTVLWTTIGGTVGTRCDSLHQAGTSAFWRFKIPKAVCSTWVATPTSNYGVRIKSDTLATGNNWYGFRSSEYVTTPSQRPKFTVWWTQSGATTTLSIATVKVGTAKLAPPQ